MTTPTKRASSHTVATQGPIAAGSPAQITAAQAPLATNLLIVRVGSYLRSGTVGVLSDNRGNTWTPIVEVVNTVSGTQHLHTGIYKCRPSTVTAPFTVSWTPTAPGGTTFSSLIYDELDNFDTSTENETGVGATGTGVTPTANIADTTADCMKLGVATWLDTLNGTPVTGNTLNGYTGDGIDEGNAITQAALGVFKSITGSDATDPQCTLASSDPWSFCGVAIRGAAAGGDTLMGMACL